jgi:hypothetical protein
MFRGRASARKALHALPLVIAAWCSVHPARHPTLCSCDVSRNPLVTLDPNTIRYALGLIAFPFSVRLRRFSIASRSCTRGAFNS